jgi:sugar O-acyltransferase (sialic acid O-acetyltransferase NeuD family)
MIKSTILVPLLNANEPDVRVVAIHAKTGQAIDKGALLITIETTKATSEIESPEAGFVVIYVKVGDILEVGDKLAVITDTVNNSLDLFQSGSKPTSSAELFPAGTMRITKPAQIIAESLGIDLSTLPTDRLITEDVVRQMHNDLVQFDFVLPASEKPALLIFGGGGHAKTIIEMVRQIGAWIIAGILDDNPRIGEQMLGIPVLGTRTLLPMLVEKGVILAANGVGGINDIGERIRIFRLLESSGFTFPALIHPRAVVESSAKISEGVQVFANTYIGSEVTLGKRCMVNTNAVVSHNCEIGEYTHIAPGALLAGHVHVGERTLIGMGITTTIGINIGSKVRIGNGAIVLADVPDMTIIQAGRYWVGKAE